MLRNVGRYVQFIVVYSLYCSAPSWTELVRPIFAVGSGIDKSTNAVSTHCILHVKPESISSTDCPG